MCAGLGWESVFKHGLIRVTMGRGKGLFARFRKSLREPPPSSTVPRAQTAALNSKAQACPECGHIYHVPEEGCLICKAGGGACQI